MVFNYTPGAAGTATALADRPMSVAFQLSFKTVETPV
jgi:hypothetical protein